MEVTIGKKKHINRCSNNYCFLGRGSTRHPLSERYGLAVTVLAAWRVNIFDTWDVESQYSNKSNGQNCHQNLISWRVHHNTHIPTT